MSTKLLPLVYFSHAELKSKDNLDIQLAYENGSGDIGRRFEAMNGRKAAKKLKLSLRDDDMNYEGVEEDDQPYLVASLNKKTNDLVVFDSTVCFNLKPKCYLSDPLALNTPESPSNKETISYSEKLDSLTAAFGSSKKRKAMQVKLKNKLDSETLENAVSAAVNESKQRLESKGTKGDESEEENDESAGGQIEQFSIVPVPNPDAKSPSEVYDLNDLFQLTPSEFDRYTLDLSHKFATANMDTIKKWQAGVYPQYIIDHLQNLCNNTTYGHQYKLQKCKQLAFMSFLLALYGLRSNQLRAKSALGVNHDMSDAVLNKLFDLYTVVSSQNAFAKQTRSMPRRLKDKLTCHILVLALHIDDFNSASLETIQKDLKVSMQRLTDFYQTLGCHVKSQVQQVNGKKSVSKRATLSLPLFEIRTVDRKKNKR